MSNQHDSTNTEGTPLDETLAEEIGGGLSCSPGSLKFQIDALRANLRRFRELDANYGNCFQKAESLKSRDAELKDEYDLKCARLQWLLDEAQVETPEKFREECARKQRLLDLLEKETSRMREFQRLAGKLTRRTSAAWDDVALAAVNGPVGFVLWASVALAFVGVRVLVMAL